MKKLWRRFLLPLLILSVVQNSVMYLLVRVLHRGFFLSTLVATCVAVFTAYLVWRRFGFDPAA